MNLLNVLQIFLENINLPYQNTIGHTIKLSKHFKFYQLTTLIVIKFPPLFHIFHTLFHTLSNQRHHIKIFNIALI